MKLLFLLAFLDCNFTYSLLGIETIKPTRKFIPSGTLQFHLLPIRDWNRAGQETQKLEFWLQFHLLPIRDWN